MNLYAYVRGNPINKFDFKGLMEFDYLDVPQSQPSLCMQLCLLDKVLMLIPVPGLSLSPWDIDYFSYRKGFTDSWHSTGEEDAMSSGADINATLTKKWGKNSLKAARYLSKLNVMLSWLAGIIDLSADMEECKCRCQNQ